MKRLLQMVMTCAICVISANTKAHIHNVTYNNHQICYKLLISICTYDIEAIDNDDLVRIH